MIEFIQRHWGAVFLALAIGYLGARVVEAIVKGNMP